MPGPFSSDHPSGPDGPWHGDVPPGDPAGSAPPPGAAHPGRPPLPYPRRSRGRRVLITGIVAVLAVAAVTALILFAARRAPVTATGAFSDATATAAIQGYLDALQDRDTETISRHALCGIYDAVRDRRSDQAVAKLSSDAFRKQFSEARVTSIDKIVYWSDYQAQVLFSMRVQSVGGGSARSDVQGVAQLLTQHNQILVCSYVLRTAGLY